MSGIAAGKIGLGALKSLWSPTGLCVVSVISIILIGFNPLFLGFDLIVKSMNILSGNALIQMALRGIFDPKNPVFIIYITVFITSFILMIVKLIKNSVQDLAGSRDFRKEGQKINTISGTKLKWVLIWLLSWFIMPFVFGIILFVLNLFVSLFGLTPLSISVLDQYSVADWDSSITAISNSINEEILKIDGIIEMFFPKDIQNITELPNFLNKSEVTLDQWKNFLTELSKNNDAMNVKSGLSALSSKLSYILSNRIFTIKGAGVLQLSTAETAKLINDLAKQINEINKFVNDSIPLHKLEIAFSDIAKLPNINWNTETISLLLKELNGIDTTIKSLQQTLVSSFMSTKLHAIGVAGIEGQKQEIINGVNQYQAEDLTIALARALYQNPTINSFWMGISSTSSGNSIPIIGVISTIGAFFQNPISIVDVFISTFAFAFCFTTFFSLLLIFAKKLFEYISMLAVMPFATSSGINDAGEKFSIWWKTLFGKIIVVFSISITLTIFTVVLNLAGKFIFEDALGDYSNMDFVFRRILVKTLLMTIVIATSGEMLNFIGWVAQIFSVDNKVDKYRNSFTNRNAKFIQNAQQGYRDHAAGLKVKNDAAQLDLAKSQAEAYKQMAKSKGSLSNLSENGKKYFSKN